MDLLRFFDVNPGRGLKSGVFGLGVDSPPQCFCARVRLFGANCAQFLLYVVVTQHVLLAAFTDTDSSNSARGRAIHTHGVREVTRFVRFGMSC